MEEYNDMNLEGEEHGVIESSMQEGQNMSLPYIVYNANKLTKLVNEKKKKQNWLDYYQLKYTRNQSKRPTSKTGFLGLCGKTVDAIDFNTSEIEKLSKKISDERMNIIGSTKYIMPAAFVSFRTRWAAAVCAQTQQARNPTVWLTE
ncbi:CSC1-like protein At1g62320 [Lycium barbarum]|uniref:CSC1-like protein At1g62320 n=1 Tax=Lycium barbarum TaxID=112863 RepID=UPI00293F328D|nr:CSC1-like protein At1g62320 [Lycium barbarum]